MVLVKVIRTQLNHLASLAKWLSVRLRTKWFWVRVQLQRRLDYIFISQNFQEIDKHIEIINTIGTDHSPVSYLFQNLDQFQRGLDLWKFHNSLVSNEEYLSRLKELVNKIQ